MTPLPTPASPARVAHVNWSDSVGGAARVAMRLIRQLARQHTAFSACLLASHRMCLDESEPLSLDPTSWLGALRTRIDRAPLQQYPARTAAPFSVNWIPTPALTRRLQPFDLLHLHWIGGGLINVHSLAQLGLPVVWTLHDVWPVSGGCHINYHCNRLGAGCGRCPALGSERDNDLSRRAMRRKAVAYAHMRPTLVAPSNWVADIARRSPLAEHCDLRVIPNGVDLCAFQPGDRTAARRTAGCDLSTFCILFGAVNSTTDPNKGFDLLVAALGRLRAHGVDRRVTLVVFGASSDFAPPSVDVNVVRFGHVSDERQLARLYAACDVTAVPSRLESFGQTALESLACGTPVVAFAGSGLSEIVEHGITGHLARPYDIDDFAAGLASYDRARHEAEAVSGRCVQAATERFSIASVAARYAALYAERLTDRPRPQTGQGSVTI